MFELKEPWAKPDTHTHTHTHTHTRNKCSGKEERTGLTSASPVTPKKGGLRRNPSHCEGGD